MMIVKTRTCVPTDRVASRASRVVRANLKTKVDRWGCHAYIGMIVASATATLIAETLTRQNDSPFGARPGLFLLFASLLVLGELRPIRWLLRLDGGEVTATWSFALALVLIAPGPAALAIMALGSVAGDLSRAKALDRVLFNAGQVVLCLEAAQLLLTAGGVEHALASGRSLPLAWLPVAATAAAAAFILNGLLTSIVFSLAHARPLWPTMREAVTSNAEIDGMLLALSPVFVVVAGRSLVLMPLLLITALVVYRNAHAALAGAHQATHDALTSLPNRRLFESQMAAAVERADRQNEGFAVILIDLDGFKQINDRLGHETGDLTLKGVAERLLATRRPADFVARLGGDEFAVLVRRIEHEEDAVAVAERMRASLAAPLMVDGFPVTIGASLGIALYPRHGRESLELLEHADTAMYIAKRGERHVEMSSAKATSTGRSHRVLLGELEKAIVRGDFVLHYQPKVDARTGRVVGAEALVRWEHPTLGRIPPDEFIPFAEQTDLMAPFTKFVIGAATRDCAEWAKRGISVPVAVNASVRNVEDATFPGTVAAALAASELHPSMFRVEITENAAMANAYRVTEVLTRIRELGVEVSIDDFGTGFSSLANLRRLPADELKVDKTFVTAAATDGADQLVVQAIVNLAHGLGLRVVAEGVEDAACAATLRALACDHLQGYHFARPLPGDEFEQWVRVNDACHAA